MAQSSKSRKTAPSQSISTYKLGSPQRGHIFPFGVVSGQPSCAKGRRYYIQSLLRTLHPVAGMSERDVSTRYDPLMFQYKSGFSNTRLTKRLLLRNGVNSRRWDGGGYLFPRYISRTSDWYVCVGGFISDHKGGIRQGPRGH